MKPLNKDTTSVYGHIEHYSPGEYRIVLTVDNKKLDETEFTVFNDEDYDVENEVQVESNPLGAVPTDDFGSQGE